MPFRWSLLYITHNTDSPWPRHELHGTKCTPFLVILFGYVGLIILEIALRRKHYHWLCCILVLDFLFFGIIRNISIFQCGLNENALFLLKGRNTCRLLYTKINNINLDRLNKKLLKMHTCKMHRSSILIRSDNCREWSVKKATCGKKMLYQFLTERDELVPIPHGFIPIFSRMREIRT